MPDFPSFRGQLVPNLVKSVSGQDPSIHSKAAYHQEFVSMVGDGDETYLPVHLKGVI